MQRIQVTVTGQTREYPIIIGRGLIAKLPELPELIDLGRYTKILAVTDANLEHSWLPRLRSVLPGGHDALVLPPGEGAKNLKSMQEIWAKLHAMGCDRRSLVIALGGGALGDTAGFAAGTYMRGIDCLQLPTTVISQTDSAIGGKTAVDFDGVKNLIGLFKQPCGVIIDTETLGTLPARELTAGFGEIIKYGLSFDAAYLKKVTCKRPADFSPAEMEAIIARACQIKAEVVAQDETETGPRKLLNFGHTVGHAIEAISLENPENINPLLISKPANPLLHGEAISIGMVAEAEFSRQQGFISAADVRQIRNWLSDAGLPTATPHHDIDEIMKKLRSDKKNIGGRIQFVLLKRLGEAVRDQEIDDQTIRDILVQNMENTEQQSE